MYPFVADQEQLLCQASLSTYISIPLDSQGRPPSQVRALRSLLLLQTGLDHSPATVASVYTLDQASLPYIRCDGGERKNDDFV